MRQARRLSYAGGRAAFWSAVSGHRCFRFADLSAKQRRVQRRDESRKLEEELQQKETEITELQQRLQKLEQLVAQKLSGGAM